MTAAAPVGEEWLSEVKLDGYRLLAAIDQGQVRLLTRKGLDWTLAGLSSYRWVEHQCGCNGPTSHS